jgi:hypothetical protein
MNEQMQGKDLLVFTFIRSSEHILYIEVDVETGKLIAAVQLRHQTPTSTMYGTVHSLGAHHSMTAFSDPYFTTI